MPETQTRLSHSKTAQSTSVFLTAKYTQGPWRYRPVVLTVRIVVQYNKDERLILS